MDHLEDVELLRSQGHRITPQRLQVLNVIKGNARHMTVEEIYAAIVPQQPSLDMTTVYRSLQWLQGTGLVAAFITGDGKRQYEYHPIGEYHHHLMCKQCGKSIQVADDIFVSLRMDVFANYGFSVDTDHMALLGSCADCQAAACR